MYRINIILLNFSICIEKNEKKNKIKIKRDAINSIGRPLKNHTLHIYAYICIYRRPFRGIFAASLVLFDERILGGCRRRICGEEK